VPPPEPGTVQADVSKSLAGPLRGVKEPSQLQSLLRDTMVKYRSRGLKSLTVIPHRGEPGAFSIDAHASPGTEVGTLLADRYIDLRDIQFKWSTTLQASLNGDPLGVHRANNELREDHSSHAETWLLTQLTSDWRKHVSRYEDNRIVVRITRSPCPDCGARLARRIEQLRELGYPLTMEVQALSLYKGGPTGAAGSLRSIAWLRQHHIEVTAWDITQNVAETFGPEVDPAAVQKAATRVESRVAELRTWLDAWGLVSAS
jgi:hypothetical protein